MLKGILVMSCIRPCVQLFMGLALCIADKSLGRNGQQIGMLMYPDDLCSAVIDNYGYYCLCVCLTVCWCFHLSNAAHPSLPSMDQIIEEPTYFAGGTYTSLLDHIYIQNCTIFMSGVLDTYYSDHDAIFADIALHGYQQWVPQLTRSGLKGDLYVIFRH